MIIKKTTQILTLVIGVLLFSNVSFSQESKATLDGFWGIKFGSTIPETKKILLSKKTGTIDEKNSSETSIVLLKPEFAGKTPLFMVLQFVDDKFHTAKVVFKSTLDAKVFELYDSVKKDINDKYYKTEKDYKFFKSPFEDGDGYETTALKVGKATIAAYWTFKQADGFENSVSLEIDETLLVVLNYQDAKLVKQAIEKQKNKNAKDY